MDTLQKAVLIGHTIIALLIIVLVLLQRGKGADAGAAFGAGASGTVFGSRGTGSFFSRATAVCATAFFATSLGLAYLSSQSVSAPSSLLDEAPAAESVMQDVADEMPSLETPEAVDEALDAAEDMPLLDADDVEAEDASQPDS